MNSSTSDPHSVDLINDFAAALVRRGLPLGFAQSSAEELVDHHSDLVAELRATGMGQSEAAIEATRRLGEARKLVTQTVREYQRRHWCGRWPLLAFLFGPVLLT